MKNPGRWWRFWPDNGQYNDFFITVCINLGLVAGGVMTLKTGKVLGNWLAFGVGFFGVVLAGGIILFLLCTLFRNDPTP